MSPTLSGGHLIFFLYLFITSHMRELVTFLVSPVLLRIVRPPVSVYGGDSLILSFCLVFIRSFFLVLILSLFPFKS